tara:strand:+ start:11200 stop:12258 length:1059 start_codon:yes stop_codon:yes gene_type:complete
MKIKEKAMKFKESLCFDDVLLVPQKSSINSRSEVNLETKLGNIELRIPIISSPMDTVSEDQMCLRLLAHGGLGVVHRYNSIEQQVTIVRNIRDNLEETGNYNINKIAAAVGCSGDFESRVSALVEAGVRVLCIDVAHGHHTLLERSLKFLKDTYASSLTIIAGNVATPEAFCDLSEWGADAIRVGIGGGSICSTRIQTGHGVPTFQSIMDCSVAGDANLIADGGIKNSGDVVKAIAAGADMVMLGSMLAGTKQSPGEVFVSNSGAKSKIYRGMASVEAQVAWRGEARSLEGISTTIPYKGSVDKILRDLIQNVKSGLSYSGARNITELQHRSQFIKQTNASQAESNTHILSK